MYVNVIIMIFRLDLFLFMGLLFPQSMESGMYFVILVQGRMGSKKKYFGIISVKNQ